jgi:hypothetical protein
MAKNVLTKRNQIENNIITFVTYLRMLCFKIF